MVSVHLLEVLQLLLILANIAFLPLSLVNWINLQIIVQQTLAHNPNGPFMLIFIQRVSKAMTGVEDYPALLGIQNVDLVTAGHVHDLTRKVHFLKGAIIEGSQIVIIAV